MSGMVHILVNNSSGWTDAEAWDSPYFGEGTSQLKMPGLSEISGKGVSKLEQKRVPGKSGASLAYLGADPMEFEIRTTIWTEEQLRDLKAVIKLLMPDNRTKSARKPIKVSHPALAMFGVNRLFVQEISLLSNSSRYNRAKEITIKFIQFLPTITTPQAGQVKKSGLTMTDADPSSACYKNKDGVTVYPEAPSSAKSEP